MPYINRPLDTSPTTTQTIKAGGDAINDNFDAIPDMLGEKADISSLAPVATSGDYNDLTNKPDLSVLEEVLVFPDFASFPPTGESQKVYIAEDTGYMYRWSGAEYVQLTDQTAIWGQISGSLSNQTDLQNALNAKANQSFVEGEVSDLQGQINLKANDNEVVKLTGDQSITGTKTFDHIAFDTTTTKEVTKGEFAWNDDEGTLDLGLNGGNVTLQLGQETVYRVTNNSGSLITDGMLVMAVGTVGASGRILVAPYDGTSPSKRIMGLATEDIPNGADGYVTHFGKVRGINTSMWTEGDILWASPAGNGALTNVKPEAPATKTLVAIVINSHHQVGTVLVRVSQGSNLDDDELVELETLSSGDTLVYNSTEGRFENIPNSFLSLIDTPADYSGQEGKLVKVNPSGNGLIFGDPSGTTVSWGDIQGDVSDQTDLGDIVTRDADEFVGQTSATGAAQLPVGNTAQRPATPSEGMVRRNSQLGYIEEYDGNGWVEIGGTVSDAVLLTGDQTVGGIKTFTESPIIPSATNNSEALQRGQINTANSSEVKTALNATGDAPIYACRAWVNFDGTTTPPTIRASGNVSSVVRNGTGDYTVNFITPMQDTSYTTLVAAGLVLPSSTTASDAAVQSQSTSSVQVRMYDTNGSSFRDGSGLLTVIR
ncbi:putative tail protein [Nitrincola phage 1M3-16]|uniref:putative tail protein n=1 Tax=Nitrincola phage 1M3-16 TaxID=1472912 RepID=UPI000444BFC3|nr:putative tail protein [Nitrincola phage 1M3-16]AHX01178.1 putative tail protein [Nitrincola phage 1M3-16]